MHVSDWRQWLSSKRLIVVHWLDAASKDEWGSPRESGTAQECISCGLLVSEDERSITLTHTFGVLDGKDNDICCSLSIPKGCILSIYEIAKPETIIKPVRRKRCTKP